MKKTLFCSAVVILSAILTGCVEINSSDSGSMNIAPMTIPPVDDYRPLYKIDTTRKVKASSDVKNLLWLFTWGSDNAYADNASIFPEGSILGKIFPFMVAKETAAKAAFYKACKEANCDSIIAARYEITFRNYFFYKKMSVEISGFPATLSGVETVKAKQYYIDSAGNVVFLDKIIKPYYLFDEHYRRPKKIFLKIFR